jgi:ABC-2 type transport system ATP-binding protein
MIEIQDISKKYKDHQALTAVSFSIPKGSIYGMIGHNGAGKTTLIRILTQIIKADSGQILIDGEKLNANHRLAIGYLPEERGLYKKMGVKEYLTFIARLREIPTKKLNESIDYWLERFDLEQVAKKEINSLSKGNQQKVQFISSVFFEPSILILDEPFSGFDPSNAELLKKEIIEINKKGTTIIFSTHQMEAVEELCQELTMINKSKVVLSGKLNQIKADFGRNDFFVKSHQKIVSKWNAKSFKDGEKLTLNSNQTIKDFLDTLDLNQLIRFEQLEPSLKEIFLEKVKA